MWAASLFYHIIEKWSRHALRISFFFWGGLARYSHNRLWVWLDFCGNLPQPIYSISLSLDLDTNPYLPTVYLLLDLKKLLCLSLSNNVQSPSIKVLCSSSCTSKYEGNHSFWYVIFFLKLNLTYLFIRRAHIVTFGTCSSCRNSSTCDWESKCAEGDYRSSPTCDWKNQHKISSWK